MTRPAGWATLDALLEEVRVVVAVLDMVRFLLPVIGALAAFGVVMAAVFLLVPRCIEVLVERTQR